MTGGSDGVGGDLNGTVPRPFEGSYGVSLSTAVTSLIPYIVLTTAYELFRKQVGADLRINKQTLQIISSIATAGYAFGAMVGGDVIQRFKQRSLFLICEAFFVLGCLLAATTGGTIQFGAGMVMIGLTTGLLLVIALPPVVRQFPPARMPVTTAAIDIGFFGAVTAGPLLGGFVASVNGWRWFYGVLALIGVLVWSTALFTLPDRRPPNPDQRFDWPALSLALGAAVLPFWASAELTGHSFDSLWFILPLAAGFACVIAMLLAEFHQEEPLAPVKTMWHSVPLVGTMIAMIGGGAFVTLLTLGEQFLTEVRHQEPLAAGLSFWPQVLGVMITSVLLGVLIQTRWVPLLALAGMLLLIAGGSLLLLMPLHGASLIVLSASGLLGLGAGATVSPGLWLAGFCLPSKMVGRTLALVELVRSEADFIMAPVLVQVAAVSSRSTTPTASGIVYAIWVTIMITIAMTVFMLAVYLLSGAGLERPDLQGWLKENRTALHSPGLWSLFRTKGIGARRSPNL